jgi:hypothetical protein
MLSLKEFILEKLDVSYLSSKKCKFDNKFYLEKLGRNINKLDQFESIAGLNCWDLAWSFGEYLRQKCNYPKRVQCYIYGNGSHYIPVINIKSEDVGIDFTVPNQHHFSSPIIYGTKNLLKTDDDKKLTEIIYTDEIPDYIREIELDSPEDLFDEFDNLIK